MASRNTVSISKPALVKVFCEAVFSGKVSALTLRKPIPNAKLVNIATA